MVLPANTGDAEGGSFPEQLASFRLLLPEFADFFGGHGLALCEKLAADQAVVADVEIDFPKLVTGGGKAGCRWFRPVAVKIACSVSVSSQPRIVSGLLLTPFNFLGVLGLELVAIGLHLFQGFGS